MATVKYVNCFMKNLGRTLAGRLTHSGNACRFSESPTLQESRFPASARVSGKGLGRVKTHVARTAVMRPWRVVANAKLMALGGRF